MNFIKEVKLNSEMVVIIPTLGESKTFDKLFCSLQQQKTQFSFEVIVIDNSLNTSVSEKLKLQVKNYALSIQLICSPKKGVNTARNLGIQASLLNPTAEILLFIDDDCWLQDSYLLQKHWQCHQQKDDLFAVGGYYILEEKAFLMDRCYHQIQMAWLKSGLIDTKNFLADFLIGGHVSIKKRLLQHHQLKFDENIIYGGSELSLFISARHKQLQLQLQNFSLVHQSNLSFRSAFRKRFKQGQGEAYLQHLFNEASTENLKENQTKIQQRFLNQAPYSEKIGIYFLNIFFWLGFYQKQGKRYKLFHHVLKSIYDYCQNRRYQLLLKIKADLDEKKKDEDIF